jgi:hypothetical protein
MTDPTRKTEENPIPKKASRILRLADVDYRILQLVYEHRFLDTELLWYLLKSGDTEERPEYALGKDGKKRPARYGFGLKALYKHLLKLSGAKYLHPEPMIDVPIGGNRGKPRTAYSLDIKGAPIIAEQTGLPIQRIRRIVDANRVRPLFLRHELEIARFRATLELACKNSGKGIRLIFWEQGSGLRDEVVGDNESGVKERFPVNPDAMFGIHIENKGTATYFLEMDRGTMHIVSKTNRSDIRKKIFGYMRYREAKDVYQQKYYYIYLPNGDPSTIYINPRPKDNPPFRERSNIRPIRGFNALFVTPGTLHRNKFVTGRIKDILSVFPLFGDDLASTSLFWLTTLGMYNIENPESILENIWITPNPNKPMRNLIE